MKAILINNCNDCPYAQYGGLGVICRKLEEIGKYNVPYDMDDCPLKPMPEYKWHEEGKENECEEWYRNGWNECLEEIEKC